MQRSGWDELARMAHAMYDQHDVGPTLEKLIEASIAAVRCTGASVILTRRGQVLESRAASDAVVEKVARLEVEYGEGPAFAAVREEQTQLVHDSAVDRRWPSWSAAVNEAGLVSTLTVRLWTSRVTLGALNLYDTAPRSFDAEAVAMAEALGRHASLALAAVREEQTLWEAMDARKVIGQAQGILMERFGLDEPRAFEVLRRYSQHKNIKLNEVARILVQTRQLPD